jgi:hypothetical protein
VIVVKGAVEDTFTNHLNTPTDTQGNTYTQQAVDSTTNHSWVGLWTARPATAISMTVSVTVFSAAWHSVTVEVWTAATLDATPAVNSARTGTGAPASTLTTTQSGSAVSWLNADWAANAPAGRVYDSTSAAPVEDGLHDESPTFYVAYYAYQTAASPGSQAFGMTTPNSQAWSLLGVEILDVPGPGAPEDPNQAEPIILWQ